MTQKPDAYEDFRDWPDDDEIFFDDDDLWLDEDESLFDVDDDLDIDDDPFWNDDDALWDRRCPRCYRWKKIYKKPDLKMGVRKRAPQHGQSHRPRQIFWLHPRIPWKRNTGRRNEQ